MRQLTWTRRRHPWTEKKSQCKKTELDIILFASLRQTIIMNLSESPLSGIERQTSLDFSIFARLCEHASRKTNNSNITFFLQLQNICNSPLYSITVDRKNILPAPLSESALEAFMALYIMIIVLAVLGNSLVLGLIGVVKKARRLTDFYIISLASSDLLIATLNMPFQLYHIVANDWMASGDFGAFLCKFTTYIEGVTVIASILTLLCIAIDR